MVEFCFILLTLIVLAYGLMDFCVAIYEKQLIVNLTREGANLSARGSGGSPEQVMTNALDAIMQEATPLNLSTNSPSGLLILTSVTNNPSGYFVKQQLKSGLLSAQSKVGRSGVGGSAVLPNSIVAQPGHYVYVAEIFYKFNVPAPLKTLINISITNQFYDVAYFPGS